MPVLPVFAAGVVVLPNKLVVVFGLKPLVFAKDAKPPLSGSDM